MKLVKQYSFFLDRSSAQEQQDLLWLTGMATKDSVFDPSVLKFQNKNIYQLGIQALAGTKVYINECAEPVVIGITGIFEISLASNVVIEQLKFDFDSLQSTLENRSACIIIDTIEEDNVI